MVKYNKDVIKRFWLKVRKNKTCWIWTGAKNHLGYGSFRVPGQTIQAHRFSYEIHKGEIPENHNIHHQCRNPKCVNPKHLVSMSRKDHVRKYNSRIEEQIRKTHCPYGHPYSGDDLYINPNTNKRSCRECMRNQATWQYYKRKNNV